MSDINGLRIFSNALISYQDSRNSYSTLASIDDRLVFSAACCGEPIDGGLKGYAPLAAGQGFLPRPRGDRDVEIRPGDRESKLYWKTNEAVSPQVDFE